MICRSKTLIYNNSAHKSTKILLCAVLFIFCFANNQKTFSQISTNDTNINRIFASKTLQSTYIALPLFTQSIIYKNHNFNFRDIRQKTIPSFRYDYDTYLQFAPLTLTFALKYFGLQSKSNWSELGVSSSLSMGLGLGLVILLKDNIEERRPEYAAMRSFPSGHTTIAFIGASILSKEYKDNYPYLSIAGYTTAGITGLSRIMNNKHWMHDVLFGAGLGILATEFSYAVTDLIFQNNSDKRFTIDFEDFRNEKPHYLSPYLAYNHNFFQNNRKLKNNTNFSIDNGVGIGLEGTYFFNKYIGITAKAKADNYKVRNQNIWWPEDSLFSVYSLDLGIALAYPLIHRVFIGTRATLGVNHIDENPLQDDVPMQKQNNLQYSFGIFSNIWTDKHTFLRLYADYTHTNINIENKNYAFPTLAIGSTIGWHF